MRVLLVVVLLAALAGAPLVALTRVAGERGWTAAWETLTTSETGAAVRNTLVLALVVTVLGCLLGAAAAVTLRGTGMRLALLWPVLVPEFVLGFGWSQAYGPSGLVDDLLGLSLPGLLGFPGIVLVLTVHAVPLAYLAVAAGLATRAEPDLERAARASGATPFAVLRTVLLPLLRLPLLAAAVLVFVTTVNSFAIPQVLGGYPTMTTLVYANLNLASSLDAFGQLVTIALAMAVLVLVLVGLADTGLHRSTTRAGLAGAVVRTPHRAARWAIAVYTALTVGLPLLVVLGVSVTRGPGLAPVPANWTLANYRAAFAGPTWPALGRTLLLAVLAAIILTVLSGLVVSLRRPALGTLLTLCFAVPGSALAVGALIAYGRVLGTSAALILVVYLAKLWAVAYRPVLAGVDGLGADLVPAARSSGAGPVTALRTVVVPPLATALAAAAGLVFVLASHELTMSSILYGPGSQTFAVVVLNAEQLGDVGAGAALSVVLTAPLALLAFLLVRGGRARVP